MFRNLFFGLLLLLAPCAFADSIDVLSGTNHSHGFTYKYDFVVDTSFFTDSLGLSVDAVLNGTFLTYNKHVGCDPCTITFTDDSFVYQSNETQVMWQWGPIVNRTTGQQKWELVTSAGGAFITDPPSPTAATPEPTPLLLLACGVLIFLLPRHNLVLSRRERS